MKEAKLAAEDCILVGDSILSDMEAAKEAGIKGILMDRKQRQHFHPKIKNTVICSSLTLAEIVSKFARKQMDFKEVVYGITSLSRVIEVDELMAVSAGEIHASVRKYIKDFGLVDAFLLSIARSSHAKILTGDPHFKGFPEATMLFTK